MGGPAVRADRHRQGFPLGGYGDISALITGEVGGPRIAAPGLLTPWGQYPEDKTVTDTFDDVPMTAGRTGTEASTHAVSTEQEAEAITEDATILPSAVEATGELTDTTESDGTDTPAVESTEDAEESDETTTVTETTETDDADGTEKTEKAETATAGKKVRGEKAVSTVNAEAADQPDKADKAEKANDDAE